LTKGPLAPAIAIGTVLTFWMIDLQPRRLFTPRDWWDDLRSAFSAYHALRGLVIFLIVAGPWYLAMAFRHRMTFVDSFVMAENVERFQTTIFGHHGSIAHYLQTIFHGMYPWIGMLAIGVPFLFTDRLRLDEETRQRWYYISWFLAVFFVFSAASTKIDHYILPISFPVAILTALIWERYLRGGTPHWIRPVFLVSLLLLMLTFKDFMFGGSKYIMDVFTTEGSIRELDTVPVLIALLVAWVVAISLSTLLRRKTVVATLALAVAYSGSIYFSHYVMPAHSRWRNLKRYTDHFQSIPDSGTQLIFFGKIRSSMYYYQGRTEFNQFDGHEAAAVRELVRGKSNVYMIVQNRFKALLYAELQKNTDQTWYIVSPEQHPGFEFITNDPRSADPEAAIP